MEKDFGFFMPLIACPMSMHYQYLLLKHSEVLPITYPRMNSMAVVLTTHHGLLLS
jgi:hypothetical protein